MGMGNYACYADTVSEDFVKEICPEELKNLQLVLGKNDFDMDRLGRAAMHGDLEGELGLEIESEVAINAILNVYDALCQAFRKETGLGLELMYHDKDDRGDEVDGYFWGLEGVYIYSPAGEKHKDKIQRKTWTEFG
jgi:hypothetical protein